MRKLRLIPLTLALIMCLTACGSSNDSSYASSYDNGYIGEVDSMVMADTAYYSTSNSKLFGSSSSNRNQSTKSESVMESTKEYEVAPETEVEIEKKKDNTEQNYILLEDKLIYRCTMSLETLDFDNTYDNILGAVASMGGIIQSERMNNNNGSYSSYRYSSSKYVNGKECTLTVRIPSEYYREFTNIAGELGNLISKNSSTENITQQYYDSTAQLEGLQIQLARLQEMLRSATEIEDLITLNKEISDLEYRIGVLTTDIRTMDMDVAYSYVTVTILEVVEYTEIEEAKKDTFFNRLLDTFKDSFENVADFLEEALFAVIMIAPFLVLIAIVFIVINKLFGKKIKAKKEEKKQEYKEIISILSTKSPENKDKGDLKDEPKR